MSINKNVVVQGKAIKLELDGSGSLSNSFGKLNLEKTKNRENIIYHSWNLQVEETTYAQEKDNCGRDEVQIMFNLSQDINWSYNFNTGSEQVQMSKGEVCVFRNRYRRPLQYATSLHSYVQDKRLEYAARLLQENELPISQAAQLSGYTNMSHFSKSFVKKFGVLPKDY